MTSFNDVHPGSLIKRFSSVMLVIGILGDPFDPRTRRLIALDNNKEVFSCYVDVNAPVHNYGWRLL